MANRSLGTVRALHRYPVKSMAAEPIETSPVSWHGFAGDRRWAFLRPGSERSGFPWFTIREKPDLWRYSPRFLDPTDVESSKTMVRTPDGADFDVADPELARRLGDGVRVFKQYSGVFDTFPLSLLTVQSVDGLSALVNQSLAPLRFRPNILIDATGSEPYPEDRWASATLRIGSLRLRLDKRDKRCVMVNVDPTTIDSNPNVLRAIATERDAQFGMYGTTVEPGQVSIGDEVFLEE
ncbi:MAG: MOSC domain-containing protein [Acidobacteria bacterium]|nr:MOSC domain-containing protein [Acidobacteriota bacterium]